MEGFIFYFRLVILLKNGLHGRGTCGIISAALIAPTISAKEGDEQQLQQRDVVAHQEVNMTGRDVTEKAHADGSRPECNEISIRI